MSSLLSIFNIVLGILKDYSGFLFVYFQGKKAAKAVINEEIVEHAKDSAKNKNNITTLDDSDISAIVFTGRSPKE